LDIGRGSGKPGILHESNGAKVHATVECVAQPSLPLARHYSFRKSITQLHVNVQDNIAWLRSNCVLSNSEQGEKNNLQQGNHARLAAQLFHRATFDVSKEKRSAAYLSLYIAF
jgi:hypothetical protein